MSEPAPPASGAPSSLFQSPFLCLVKTRAARAGARGIGKTPLPLLLLACLLCAALALPAGAALRPKRAEATPAEAANPHPAPDDITLPMPCGAVMAFRAVGTQGEGFLDDLETLFGCDACDRKGNDYYERRYSAAVSGPFAARDLPPPWRKTLPRPKEGRYSYYFMGKYEISVFQWRAVMEGWCPQAGEALTLDDARPKTGMSWFDAVAFSKAYTEWLLQNAPEALPRFHGDGKNVGYLRLPTEAEWEYAARGGHAVPRASLRETDFFPLEDGADYARYAVYRAEGAAAAEESLPIGSRSPNPLGLYDTAGNAAEMVLTPFSFSLGGRLHGSAGGFVRKGGSFLSSAQEILPGRREEAAFFISDGPGAARDMGARLVLSGINTPAGNRPADLAKEWQRAGESRGPLPDTGKNPLEELDRLIETARDAQERESLARLRGVLKDNNIALERQQAAAAESLVRSSLFMVETVRNYGVRHKGFVNMLASSRAEREKARNMSAAVRRQVEETIAELEKSRAGMERSLDAALAFYRGKVEESQQYAEALFDATLGRAGAELAGDDLLTRNMRLAHALYARHVDMMRHGKRDQLTRDRLLRDILPDNLREGLL